MDLALVCHAAVAAVREVWRESVTWGKEGAFPLLSAVRRQPAIKLDYVGVRWHSLLSN